MTRTHSSPAGGDSAHPRANTGIGDPRQVALLAAAAALAKKAEDLLLLDVSGLCSYADFFLFATGRSTRQAAAVAEGVRRSLKKAGVKPLGLNGLKEGRWAVLDYGDVVVHVFFEPVRAFYDLESHWEEASPVELDPKELAALKPLAEKA